MGLIAIVLMLLAAGALVWRQLREDRRHGANGPAVPTQSNAAPGSSTTEPEALYATFPRRLDALSVDALVMIAVSVLLFGLMTQLPPPLPGVLLVLILVVAILYEPFQVSRWGYTIGHRALNLRVVYDRTGEPPSFWRAFGRVWLKGPLGLLAFITMGVSRRHRAIHDILTRTSVQIRDEARAQPHHYVRAPAFTVQPNPRLERRAEPGGVSLGS